MKRINFWLVALFLVSLIFSSPFVFKDKIPIPADTILGMYHPWRDKVWDGFTAGVPFKNFLITDPVRQQFVWKKLSIESFKKGQLPLWNPYTHSGMPLLANFQTGAFYPLNLLFLLLSFDFAWGVYILLQPLLASIFMFFFLRELKLSNFASFFGGIAFAFSGFMTAWLEWGNLGHTALWLPLILLAIEKIMKNSGIFKWGAVLVFSLIASFFAGHLQTFFYLFCFSLFYLFWRIFKEKPKKRLKKAILLFVFCFLLFVVITIIQWLPTLQLIKLSAREIDQATLINQSGWFLPFKHLVQFLAPDFFGNPVTMNYWGEWNYGELVGYVGVIPLVFALNGIFTRFKAFKKEKSIKLLSYWIIGLFIVLLFLLPTPLAKLPFLLKIPFISTAQPTRLLFIVDFCLAVLAAFGLNRFIKKRKESKKILLFTVYCLLFTFLILWFFAFFKNLTVTQRNLILPTGILFLFLVSTFLKRRVTCYLLLVAILTVFDLIRFSWKFNPFVKKDWIFPKTKLIEFLEKDQSLWRMMTLDRRIFPPNFSAVYHLETIEGYDPLYLKDYGCLISRIEGGEGTQACGSFNRILRPQNFESGLIDELNVRYILSLEEISHPKLKKVFQERETRVYENLKVKPRIKIPSGQVKVIDYQANKIILETESKKPGDLVLRDFYYPGWKVKVDDKEKEIFQAENYFRGVSLEKGKHKVEFYYLPSW